VILILTKAIIQERQDAAKAIQADLEVLISLVDKDDLVLSDTKNLGVKNRQSLKGQLTAASEHLATFIKMVGK